MSMFKDLNFPLIIAHRGASIYAPENTIAAFELAHQQGAQAVELDAKLSADGHVMVIHDQTVNRTTDGTGKVRDLSLHALKKLDAGIFFGSEFKNEPIPTLDEVFEAVGKKLIINIELTNYATPFDDLPRKTAELVNKYNLADKIFFSTFNPIALFRIRQLLPDVPAGLLLAQGLSGKISQAVTSRFISYQSLHPHYLDMNQDLITKAHRKNQLVFTYTVNIPDDMRQLFKLGVDGIFTDDPPLAQNILNEVKPKP